ncbi:MAG: patatin-like phospholipase family protein [Treponema sp.]|nr:patatin-like phospholipase family protein [Candidatus Treponema caballi]
MRKLLLILMLAGFAFTTLFAESNLLDADIPLTYGGEQFVARIQAKTGGTREPVGLVLSGGSARAFAHIGVLKYLEEQGIVPDFIVSNSMGSIIGMLYGAGLSPDQILEIMTDTDIGGLFDLALPANRGLINSDRFRSLVSAYLGKDLRVEDLAIPVMVVCEDLVTKQQIRICEGDFYDVLDASYALPVYFSSISYNGHKLVDGGIANISPIGIAYDYSNCNMVSTTFYAGKNLNLNNPITALNTSIDVGKRRQGVVDLLNHPDAVWIRCDVEEFSFMEFSACTELCERGYASALEQADAIASLKDCAGGAFTGPSAELLALRTQYEDKLASVHKEYAPFKHVKNSVVSFYPSITGITKDTALRSDSSVGAGATFRAGNFTLDTLAGAAIALSTDDTYCKGLVGAEAAWFILPPLRLSAGFSWFPTAGSQDSGADSGNADPLWSTDGALTLRIPGLLPDGALEIGLGAEYTSDSLFAAQVSAAADANFGPVALDLKAGVRSSGTVESADDFSDIGDIDNFTYFGDFTLSLVSRSFSRGFAEMLIVTNPRIGAFCTAQYASGNGSGSSGSEDALSLTAGLELGTTVGLIGLRNIPFRLRAGWNFADESVYASLHCKL